MSARGTFAFARQEQLPGFLDGPRWRAAQQVLGEAQDTEIALLTEAVLMRYPPRTPADALDYLGAASGIERFPGETDASYGARLEARWPTWQEAGSKGAIVDSLNAWGIPDVEIFEDWEGHFAQGEMYSRFWVVLGPDFGTTGIEALVAPFNGGGVTGGSTATPAQVEQIKRQVLKWKFAYGYPVHIILRFGSVILGNVNSTPPFTPPLDATFARWHLGKLAVDNIFGAPFTPGGFDV